MVAWLHHKTQAERLIWVFAGWGMDENVFRDQPLPGLPADWQEESSLLVLYEYGSDTILWKNGPQTIELTDWEQLLNRPELKAMKEHALWAWSMGVWAAEQFSLPNMEWGVAVNGTASPVHDTEGIPPAIFQATLQGLSEVSLEKFRRRMCGSAARLAAFKTRLPRRTLPNLFSELSYIGRMALNPIHPYPQRWNKALLSTEDAIFPIQNSQSYWQSRQVPCELRPGPHYPFDI